MSTVWMLAGCWALTLVVLYWTIRDAARERDTWVAERQQLLDRIQAPSFGEYKQAEIRLEKVRSGEKDPPKLEPL